MLSAIRFATVGVANTVLDVALFAALVAFAAAPPTAANVVSYSAGVVLSFVLNRGWTFRGAAAGRPVAKQFLRFAAVNVTALMLSTAIVAMLATLVTPVAAKLVSLPVTFAWSFLLSRSFVFRRLDEAV